MSFRPATAEEKKVWDDWLLKSHGIKTIPDANVHCCDLDCPMVLMPMKKLDELVIRLDRSTGQPVMTFLIHHEIRTIALFCAIPDVPRMSFISLKSINLLQDSLLESAKAGRLWWGTGIKQGSSITTSVLCLFPRTFPVPADVKKSLVQEPLAAQMETSLDLV